jgi:threonine aldolase
MLPRLRLHCAVPTGVRAFTSNRDWASRRVESTCFASDNTRGVMPEILDALAAANVTPSVPSYGGDPLTEAATESVQNFLGAPGAVVLPMVSGIASDALGICSAAGALNMVYCHRVSHIHLWQCGATAFYTGGAVLHPLGGADGKICPDELARELARSTSQADAPYAHRASVLSLTQPTECGTLYTEEETAALSSLAHEHGLLVHMDGARLTNAVSALGTTAADLTHRAGVDILVRLPAALPAHSAD